VAFSFSYSKGSQARMGALAPAALTAVYEVMVEAMDVR
jgi:hypothetical protein